MITIKEKEKSVNLNIKKMKIEIFKNNQLLELYFKYNKTIIDKIKSIKGAKFISSNKSWTVPSELEVELLECIGRADIEFEYITKPQMIINADETKGVTSIINQDDFSIKLPIPKTLWTKMIAFPKISSSEKDWVISKEYFMEFQKLCLESNIFVNLKL